MSGKRHRLVRLLIVFVLLLVCAVFFLPLLISSGPGRTAVVRALNQKIPGTLEVEYWRLKWRGGLAAGPIRYEAEGQQPLSVALEAITLERGLFGLLRNYPDLGLITLDTPVVRLPAPPPAAPPVSGAPPSGETEVLPEPIPSPLETVARPADPGPKPPMSWPPIRAKVGLREGRIETVTPEGAVCVLIDSLEVDATLSAPGQTSTVHIAASEGGGKGTFKMEGGVVPPADGSLDVHELTVNLQVDVVAWGAQSLVPLWSSGAVPDIVGTLDAHAKGGGSLHDGLELGGTATVAGLEIEDEGLAFGEVGLNFAGRLTDVSMVLSNLEVRSDFMNVTTTGTFGGERDGTFSSEAEVNLDRTMILIGHLGLGPSNLVAQGRIEAKATGTTQGGIVLIDESEVTLRDLHVSMGDKTLVQEEVTLTILDATIAAGAIEVRKFTCVLDALSLNGAATYAADRGSRFSCEAVTELERLAPALQALDLLPPDLELAGGLKVRAAGDQTGAVVNLTEGTTRITDLSIVQGERSFRQKEVRFKHTGTLDLARRHVSVTTFEGTGDFGEVQMKSGEIGDWSVLPASLTAEVEASCDLGTLLPILKEAGVMKGGMSMTGKGQATVSITSTSDENLRLVADARVADWKVEGPDLPPLGGDELAAGLTMEAAHDLSRLAVSRAELTSPPANLSATGSLSKADGRRELRAAGEMAADLEQVTALVHSFSDLDIEMSGKEEATFHVVGRSRDGAGWQETMATTEALFDLRVGRIDIMGLDLTDLGVPVSLSNGLGGASVSGGVNNGILSLAPSVDFTADVPVLQLPEGSNVLAGVELTTELADSLLGRIHPLFKGATILGGSMGLRMDTFSWPLAPAARDIASFSGQLVFADLELGVSGMLEKLFDTLKIRERSFSIGQRDIDFSCTNGRIECSPTRIKVEGQELVLAGTMGLDQSLDYHVIVPVTKNLVGKEVFPYLEGTTLRIPIRGTATHPELNLHSLEEGLAGLIAQAAQKALQEQAGKWLGDLLK